ncbi:Zn-dependent exopeptidase [Fomitiporia mediterranea MF3/22]|uniref:Zn-dependent exopeptidase n=1 Tax=Fomitiporia mediterranea (strain MF3/22) TaxID=694068 RepID=UPI0004408546|nr:Zn-dependent exopeptidase [Fomitiporia mediterranea MF3/22]EJD01034.1 Zn-dependent exopeptidase [Fomitiporia mediterranea MF3/22]
MLLSTTAILACITVAAAQQTVLDDILRSADVHRTDFVDIYEAYPEYSLDLGERRVIQFDPSARPVVLTELEKIELKAQGVKFFDITDSPDLGSHGHLRRISSPSFPAPNATKQVKSVIETLSTDGMIENLETFTGFRTRYYRSDTGRQSQLWLLSRINEITSTFASESVRNRISISEFPHSWAQKSIIVKIAGTLPDDEGIIIVGAHQDSAHTWPFLPAPGADDDGSGTMSILEAYRGLVSTGFSPKHTVEFHFYSAEEGGLLGSQAVAHDYESRGVNVLAMSQFDMTAWVKRGTKESVGIITDYTDNGLTEFNKALVEKYLTIPHVDTKCGYACSDHASWGRAGYPAIFTIESKFEESNPYIHSGNDRIDVSDEFSFEHMLEFAKLAAAFAIELGQWVQD